MKTVSVAVVGGGAAGLAAAVGAARTGGSVAILERMPRLGRKLLATGSGRCNLLNERLDASAFTPESRDLVRAVLDRFGTADLKAFLEGLGLALTTEGDRVFPATQQAASVLKAFEIELGRLAVDVRTSWEVRRLAWKDGSFALESRNGEILGARKVVLAGGGKSYPALGADGNAYALAGAFGHGLVEPVPSAVPVVVKDKMCHVLQGQKVRVRAASLIDGRPAEQAEGEILFASYGLSGTAVLDVSESLSRALNRERRGRAELAVDLLPLFARSALAAELERRRSLGWKDRDLATGLLPEKFGATVEAWARAASAGSTGQGGIGAGLAARLKDLRFKVEGTRGWNEAEFTSGGIPVDEVDQASLESKLRPGLFLAGEILDVQGRRGGFNLAWAWASGLLAGGAGKHSERRSR
jgi:predicted Rossmann fold flavoprotein